MSSSDYIFGDLSRLLSNDSSDDASNDAEVSTSVVKKSPSKRSKDAREGRPRKRKSSKAAKKDSVLSESDEDVISPPPKEKKTKKKKKAKKLKEKLEEDDEEEEPLKDVPVKLKKSRKKVEEDSSSDEDDDNQNLFTKELNSEIVVGTTPSKRKLGDSQEDADKKKKQKTTKDSVEKEQRTIFVGNVPLKAADTLDKLRKVLKEKFATYGDVESVRLRSVPIAKSAISPDDNYKTMLKVSVLRNNIAADASSCNAYVVFKKLETVEKVLSEDDIMLSDFHLRVDTIGDSGQSLFEKEKTVFVGNLPFHCTEESLRELFGSLDNVKVENVKVVRDRVSNLGKGIAYVAFASADMVKKALKLHEVTFEEREIRVTRYGDKKSSGKTKKKLMKGKGVVAKGKQNFQGTRATFSMKQAARMRLQKKQKHQNRNKNLGKKKKGNRK